MNDRRKNLSLAEIGRRFHVSAATVSNILNNKGKFSPELAGKILAFVDEVEYLSLIHISPVSTCIFGSARLVSA